MREILDLAASKGVAVIEDCAQAHGALLDGKRAGSWGRVATFSFYPTKNLGALGDGGAVVTSDSALAGSIRRLRQYGWSKKYDVSLEHGRNSRLDELQAAFLERKLRHLDGANARRRAVAQRYAEGINHPSVAVPAILDERYVAHLFVIKTPARAALRAHFDSLQIPNDVHYPIPDYRQQILLGKYTELTLPETERACSQVLTLPCFPEMTDDEIDAIIDGINAWPNP
jgi:dTDP-4-amino-4,6-dideoxygalactose transaminase